MAQISVEDLAQLVLYDSKQEEVKTESYDVSGKTMAELKTSLKDLCVSIRTDLVQSRSLRTSPAYVALVLELSNQLLAELATQQVTAVDGTYSKRKSFYSFSTIQSATTAAQSLDEAQLDAQLEQHAKSFGKVLLHTHKALLLARRNAFDQARSQLESAALLYDELDHSSIDVPTTELASTWSLIGVLRSLDGAYESASQAFERSLSLRPECLDTLTKYAVFIFPADQVKAKHLFDRAELVNPKSSDYHYHVAQYYCFVRNFASALENAEMAVKLDVSNACAHFLVQQIILETKNQEKLRGVLEQVLSETNNTDVLGVKGQFLLSTGQTNAALRVADQLASLEADNPAVYTIRGHAFCQMGKIDESIASFEEALKLETNSEILLSLAQLKSYKSQSLDEATSYLELIRQAILQSKNQTEKQTLAGIFVTTEADIEAARALGLSTIVSTGN
jgi:tetratricopeptide (TPR) repeat protein